MSTRREFLKSSAAASAAIGTLAMGLGAHAAGGDTIRVGMIGCGGRCTGAALDALEADSGARLVAMGDLFANRVKNSRNTIRNARPKQVDVDDDHCFVGLDAYKKVIDSSDVVLIACAAKFHPMYMMAAIQAGRHVFVEKPHAIDPPGIRMVQEACALAKEKKVSVQSGLHSRWDPGYQETMKRIHDGQIGDIVAIEENFIREPYMGTVSPREGMKELHWQYSLQYRFSWLCGDDVTQSLVHNLDRSTWALQGQTPIKCHGLGGRSSAYLMPWVCGDVFDHHSVVYHYPNGVRLYAFCRTQQRCYNENSSIILGTRGTAYPLASRIDGQNKWRFAGPGANPYKVEHQVLFKAIRSGEPINAGDYMAKSTLVAIMGQLSCYGGKEITWDQATKSNHYLGPRPEDCTWDMDPPVKPDANGVYPVAVPGVTVAI
jgi:predicted dehydrogenase